MDRRKQTEEQQVKSTLPLPSVVGELETFRNRCLTYVGAMWYDCFL